MTISIKKPLLKTSMNIVDQGRRTLIASAAIGLVAAGTATVLDPNLASAATEDAIRPFRANAADEDLMDLRRRIQMTRCRIRRRSPISRREFSFQNSGLSLSIGRRYDWRKAKRS